LPQVKQVTTESFKSESSSQPTLTQRTEIVLDPRDFTDEKVKQMLAEAAETVVEPAVTTTTQVVTKVRRKSDQLRWNIKVQVVTTVRQEGDAAKEAASTCETSKTVETKQVKKSDQEAEVN